MAAERESEQEFKERLNQKLQNSGEIERLKKTLRERLQNCGWTDQMKSICKGKKKIMSNFFKSMYLQLFFLQGARNYHLELITNFRKNFWVRDQMSDLGSNLTPAEKKLVSSLETQG